MEKEFVNYELALKLKELGYNELCLSRFDGGGFRMLPAYAPLKNDEIKEPWFCVTPLWQQAFDFILNKFDLVGTVYANASGYLYEIHDSATKGGTHRAESGYDGDCEYSGTYTTYHKGRLACLEKLIELCEKN